MLIDASHEDEAERIIACLPPAEQEARRRHGGGEHFEAVDVFACSDQVRDAQPLPDIPVVVLTAEQADWPVDWPVECLDRVHKELQLALATQTPSSRRVIVPGGHFVQLHQPQAVVDSTRGVVEQARGRERLVHSCWLAALPARSDGATTHYGDIGALSR